MQGIFLNCYSNLLLFLETGSATETRAHGFSWTDWSVSSHHGPVFPGSVMTGTLEV